MSSQDTDIRCWSTDVDGPLVGVAVAELLKRLGATSLPVVVLGMSMLVDTVYTRINACAYMCIIILICIYNSLKLPSLY